MHRHFNIDIQDVNKFVKDLSTKPFVQIGSDNFWEFGYDTKPFAEYELPKNFPNCCSYHSDVKKRLAAWMDKFPNCCANHKKLISKSWFKKEKYIHIPDKILIQLSYTENFITKIIETDNWYKEITDYIEYTIDSFGTPNIGGDRFYFYLELWVQNIKALDFEFPKWKRNQIIEFLDTISSPPKNPQTDLNILYSTFQKWLKTFPSLPFFINMKESFENKIPLNILLYEPEYNKFKGVTKSKLRTKGELIQMLITSTKSILSSVDTPSLLKKKIITNNEKYQIDLLNEQHKIKQNSLLVEYSKPESKYVKIIKKWLKNEKDYLKELEPFLKNLNNMPKLFTIEKRKVFENEYLKVFLRDKSNITDVANLISSLQSVAKANVTENKEIDITVYPAKTYSVDETSIEIDVALDSYLSKGKLDPIFEDKIIALSDKAYESIIEHIYNYGQNLEKYKSLYDKFNEEGFRDFFLPHLNSISKLHTATGETFNKIGKTDILIQDNAGLNVFIAECKLWKGESELAKAIDQLLERYVTWRDEKVALIIFNKDMQKFSDLLTKAVEKFKEHPLYDKYLGQRKESSFKFSFKHPDDDKRKISLELIIFNCF